jgi:hypothetical protein
VLTNSENELHDFLQTLPWSDVVGYAKTDPDGAIAHHINECKACRGLQDAIIDTQLKKLHPDHRQKLIAAARKLANLVREKNRRSS